MSSSLASLVFTSHPLPSGWQRTTFRRGPTSLARLSRTYATTSSATSTSSAISQVPAPKYTQFTETLRQVKSSLGGRPLTLAEKILYSHLADATVTPPARGEGYLKLRPDRVAMQDASAQMALLQFQLARLPTTAVPASIHCDHLIVAESGAEADVARSIQDNAEIFNFLESMAAKYGIAFWRPGSGIIHQIVLENYAAPGTLMLGTDSHTPNAGGLGMLAIGVGGADAVDALAHIPWELKAPKVLGVRLTGSLDGWTSPKDVILHLAGQLTVRGGTGHIIEYFGPGVSSLSCTGMATMCNMGAEVGATTSLFPYTPAMASYLKATRRSHMAEAANAVASEYLSPDTDVTRDPKSFYDRIIDIDLSTLKPHVSGPATPDASFPVAEFPKRLREEGWEDRLSAGLIGSCTNSSYEDMSRATHLVQQATEAGLTPKSPLYVTPGSEQIRATMERDGMLQVFEKAGATVLANACGPCIGQWRREEDDTPVNADNSILTSFNRNFRGRNDGNINTKNFLAAPELVTAMAFSGRLSFNPATDTLPRPDGKGEFRFTAPYGDELPQSGFAQGQAAYRPPPATIQPDESVSVKVDPESKRLQLLDPFSAWDGQEIQGLRVLVRVQGKCTTDHISAAGPWLKYKGHLENISTNPLFDTGKVNTVVNALTGEEGTIPEVAKAYKASGESWAVVADHNYGEGSAREHAAMQPRFLGCKLIIARSFARIHETNLKKQGVLPVTLQDEADYELFEQGSVVETIGLPDLIKNPKGNDGTLQLRITPADGSNPRVIPVTHTMSVDQLGWFSSGSALNRIAQG
ncbi:aconitate hydratase [Piptocephalis cylindrospora]|uniref:Aconitate hydratase, mitochondrial n=1 Tax=Piptocephalis cylindrospora TaxID=1907219 RepID=A0A4P9Y6K6_9FUNG|nr:aconitate hydratase [Piptocephalis cylindrospora]|eukprot:RKP14655.1 aconitate hydratase [Piptocephalis cylindrospora]